MREKFRLLAASIATAAGTSWAFGGAFVLILLWVITGPLFGFSDTWQLVINTGTTIVTFLMVFLIQNAQNREAIALQLKLDELLRAVKGARTGLINIDQLDDEDLERVRKYFQELGDEKECRDMALAAAGSGDAGVAGKALQRGAEPGESSGQPPVQGKESRDSGAEPARDGAEESDRELLMDIRTKTKPENSASSGGAPRKHGGIDGRDTVGRDEPREKPAA